MIYRAANSADIPAIAAIHRMARALAMPWLPVIHTVEEDHWFITNRVLPNQSVLVAEDQAIKGFVASTEGWIHHLYIDPSAQGQGIGSHLLTTVKDANPQIRLWAFRDNTKARAFYEGHGFVQIDATDGDNAENTPDVCLQWTA